MNGRSGRGEAPKKTDSVGSSNAGMSDGAIADRDKPYIVCSGVMSGVHVSAKFTLQPACAFISNCIIGAFFVAVDLCAAEGAPFLPSFADFASHRLPVLPFSLNGTASVVCVDSRACGGFTGGMRST